MNTVTKLKPAAEPAPVLPEEIRRKLGRGEGPARELNSPPDGPRRAVRAVAGGREGIFRGCENAFRGCGGRGAPHARDQLPWTSGLPSSSKAAEAAEIRSLQGRVVEHARAAPRGSAHVRGGDRGRPLRAMRRSRGTRQSRLGGVARAATDDHGVAFGGMRTYRF